jgi:NADH-quinone oxidoreductase subunit N
MPLDLTVPSQLFGALLPDLVVMVGAMALLLWTTLRPEQDAGAARGASAGAVGVCLAGLVAVGYMALRGTSALPGGALALDNFRRATAGVLLIGTALAIALGGDYARRAEPMAPETPALILLATSGMMLLAGARDLVLVFLGIELMSIPTYVLAGINRRSGRSAEAALKYFLLGAFSTAFLLYGVALVYGATGSTQLAAIGEAIARSGASPGYLLSVGIALMMVGFAFKVAAVPFHMWTPDVYDGAPAPVTAFMAVTVKTAAFAIFARVFMEAFGGVHATWHTVLWWMAVITMVFGNVVALAQRDLKRMLAYSSIAHAGYLLVAVVTNTAAGAASLVFYLLAYTLATMGAFAVVVALADGPERGVPMERITGLFSVRPWLAVAMAVFMLALLGFPLAGGIGFFAKWYLIQAALGAPAPQTRLAVVLVLASVVSAGYYLYVVAVMFMRARPSDAAPIAAGAAWTRAVIGTAAVLLLVLGVWPSGAIRWAGRSSLRAAGPATAPRVGPTAIPAAVGQSASVAP